MENKKFFIRVESNEKIGTGHLMRCLTIANSLRKMGNQVHFISKNMFMGDFNKPKGIKLYPMDELECFDIDHEW